MRGGTSFCYSLLLPENIGNTKEIDIGAIHFCVKGM